MIPKPPRPVLNRGHPLARGLMAAYCPAMESGGQFVELTRNAKKTGSVGTYVRSVGGPGLCIDRTSSGANDYIQFFDHPWMDGLRPWTISAHVKTEGTDATQYVFARTGSRPSDGLYSTYTCTLVWEYSGGSGTWGTYRSDTGVSQWTTSSAYPSGTTQYVVARFDGSNLDVFVDGKKDSASINGSVRTVTCRDPKVGLYSFWYNTSAYWGWPFNGHIYDVRLWNRALSANEIADLYADPWALYRDPAIRRQWQGWDIRPTYTHGATKGRLYTLRSRSHGIVKPHRPVINRKHSLAKGLVFAAPTSKDMVDLVGRAAPSSVAGTFAFETSTQTKVNTSLGQSDVVKYTRRNRGLVSNVSLFALVRPSSSVPGAYREQFFLSAYNTDTNQAWLSWAPSTYNIFTMSSNNGALVQTYSLGDVRATDRWYSVVGTRNASKQRLYVNGVLIGTSDVTSIDLATVDVYTFGSEYSSDYVFYAGGGSDFRIWNRVLTDSEIQSLYADPWALYSPERTIYAVDVAAPTAFGAYYYRNLLGRKF